ncbi:flagellar motor switch phosphatase FliY [Listeria ilorinensis]|uniref:flagellar motor switch phosphatase FliY n=1 Tax=Listeria ilorinensis TaxID=2867439 RepID=UPI001EF61933|nr:flagellar motor switch phosphatase FliY [Listeria ilorinensis]
MEQTIEKEKIQMELDVIGEIANISFGSASTVLSNLLNQQVTISTPHVELVDLYNTTDTAIPHVVLGVEFHKGIHMSNLFVLESKVALLIANLMMMGDGQVAEDAVLTELELSAVQEAMNQMMGHSATAMSDVFHEVIDITTPKIKIVSIREELQGSEIEELIQVSFDLVIGDLVKSSLVQLIPVQEGIEMARKLLGNPVEASLYFEKQESATTEEAAINLSPLELDVFLEVCNIGIGSASTVLSKLLNRKVSLQIPTAKIISSKEFEYNERPCLITTVAFVEGLKSSNTFIISQSAAMIMADLMMGGTGEVSDQQELTDLEISAVQELMNQMMGYSATAMSELLGMTIDISPPTVEVCLLDDDVIEKDIKEGKTVEVIFPLEVDGLLKTPLYQLFNPEAAREMAQLMLLAQNGMEEGSQPKIEPSVQSKTTGDPEEGSTDTGIDRGDEKAISADKAVLPEFRAEQPDFKAGEMDQILGEVPVEVEVVFGTAKIKLDEFMRFHEDDLLILKESVSETLAILANGKLFACGELVKVNDHFAVKITEIVE